MRGIKLDGNKLDSQQVEAVVACEDAQLVLASAGSGKTMSLLAKVEYLVCRLHIRPSNILVLSFTKKTVGELIERCKISGVEIRTFHGLGHSILRQAGYHRQIISEKEKHSLINHEMCDSPPEEIDIMKSFLMLHKDNPLSLDTIREKLSTRLDEKGIAKAEEFLVKYQHVRRRYDEYMESNNCMDYSDMITLARELVRDNPHCANHYEYILLDEVQDLSRSRQMLVREILRKNPKCRLFAVGDDWQSIYRFAGSDLALIRDFDRIFERKTRRSYIETTHRFGKPTTTISSEFICKNRIQTRKNVRPSSRHRTPIAVVFSESPDSDVVALERIISQYGADYLSRRTVQIISRFNRDVWRLKSPDVEIISRGNESYEIIWRQKLHFEFCSMHKSKGITRDIVIVLNMSSRPSGMPATRPLDPLIDVLLAPEEDFAFAEERRLFYVAITRAREQTFLIADAKHPSPFVLEINEELTD